MSTPVLIIGKSGTGKTRSIVTLDPRTTFLISAIQKDLPFRGWSKKYVPMTKDGGNHYVGDDYEKINSALSYIDTKRPEIKTVVIDDVQYLMANEFMRRAKEKGYEKFTEIGEHMWNLVFNIRLYRQDLIVFMLAHSDTNDQGETKIKTIGKLLDEKICLEGMFTICLNTAMEDGKYFFETQNNGSNTTKSPEGMFDAIRITNDLQIVIDSIIAYNSNTTVTKDKK